MRVKPLVGLFCSLAVLLAAVRTAFPNEPGAESAEALLKAVRESIQKKSKADFLKCSCGDRLTDKLKARFTATTPTFMTHEMEWIKLQPGAKDPYAGLADFEYNIQYQGLIAVKYLGMEDSVTMPYGNYQGRYYLATMVKKGTFKDQPPAPRSETGGGGAAEQP